MHGTPHFTRAVGENPRFPFQVVKAQYPAICSLNCDPAYLVDETPGSDRDVWGCHVLGPLLKVVIPPSRMM